MNKWLILVPFFFLFIALHSQSTTDRPNIIWLVTEDNSKHFLKLYHEDGASMPAIEGLAQKGVVFNNAFSNAPVCSVARSTIISGCYAPRVGSQYHRRMQLAPMPENLKMFPEYLREAGYYTTNNSKEDYNLIKSEETWDESSGEASYKNREPGQPFFHVQNFGATHEGQLHFTKSQMDSITTQNSIEYAPVFPYHPKTPISRFTNAYYRKLHQNVDSQMGEFIEKLEADGLLENTIIFYYGDHGGVLPRSKGYIYESGLHVPMVVYLPEKWKHLSPIKIGRRTDAFVQFIDLAPTVLNLAGLDIPEQIDGKPFLGKGVTTENLHKRNMAFGYADRFDEKYDMVRSLRKGKYKYVRNYQPFNIDGLFNFYRYKMLAYKEWNELYQSGKLNKIQQQFFEARSPEALYDIEKDPHETHNLVGNPLYKSNLEELRSDLQHQVKSMPDLSFYPEPYFLEEGLSNPVGFGQKNKTEIEQLVDIADLSLKSFDEVEEEIIISLNSDNPWKRYWALMVCSSFGDQAAPFFSKAEEMTKNDPENLVRIRAAEFLALNHQPVANNLFLEIVKSAKSETETNLVLNSIALLRMVNHDFEINIPKSTFPSDWVDEEGDLVNRRIDFINQEN